MVNEAFLNWVVICIMQTPNKNRLPPRVSLLLYSTFDISTIEKESKLFSNYRFGLAK